MNTNFADDIDQYTPSIVIGTLGHVANGKTTITKKLTGETTLRSDAEIKTGGKTLKLGYANGKIFKCKHCEPPMCYSSGSYDTAEKVCPICSSQTSLVQVYSIMDCPGHNSLMSLVTSGTSIVDYSILVESYPDSAKNDYIFPSPQTIEHHNVAQLAGIKKIATILNKIDLCPENNNKRLKNDITKFVNILNEKVNSDEQSAKMVIPMSAVYNINIDVLCQKIAEAPNPERDLVSNPILIVSRSFDINKPQKLTSETVLKGGTVGGALLRGTINVGNDVVIYPGYVRLVEKKSMNMSKKSGKKKKENYVIEYNVFEYSPLETNVSSIKSGTKSIQIAKPGGLIALQLDIDPSMTKGDRATGTIITTSGNKDINVSNMIMFKISMFYPGKDGTPKIVDFEDNTVVDVHINSTTIRGRIFKYSSSKKEGRVFLEKPVVIYPNIKMVISEHSDNKYSTQDGERNVDSGKNLAQCVIMFSDCQGCNHKN